MRREDDCDDSNNDSYDDGNNDRYDNDNNDNNLSLTTIYLSIYLCLLLLRSLT